MHFQKLFKSIFFPNCISFDFGLQSRRQYCRAVWCPTRAGRISRMIGHNRSPGRASSRRLPFNTKSSNIRFKTHHCSSFPQFLFIYECDIRPRRQIWIKMITELPDILDGLNGIQAHHQRIVWNLVLWTSRCTPQYHGFRRVELQPAGSRQRTQTRDFVNVQCRPDDNRSHRSGCRQHRNVSVTHVSLLARAGQQ